MIFNSLTFISFLIIVVSLFWLLEVKYKSFLLVCASCIFYGFWRWDFIPLIFISALSDFLISKSIYLQNRQLRKKALLCLSVVINLGLLFYFKYLLFFTDNTNALLEYLNVDFRFPLLYVILPFGISFYTFETISYSVDVYRGIIKPEKKFLDYLLFVTFFPKLVAGPIQRASELIPQFKKWQRFSLSSTSYALKRLLYGLFLKVVLADNIAPLVDEMFLINYEYASGVDVLTMAFLFGFQIYFDFSAYSHIALGTAKLFGIDIPENFNFPYISLSLRDFWKRWHISLSAWIRDYLYLPLAGVKVSKSSGINGIGKSLNEKNIPKTNRALFLTWAIMGIWHGSNWTFLFWGLYHAVFIYLERIVKPYTGKVKFLNNKWVTWGVTLVISMLSWIPFRANSIKDTFVLYSKIFEIDNFFNLSFRENTYIVTFMVLLMFMLTYYVNTFIMPKIKKRYYTYLILSLFQYFVIVFLIFIFLKPINQFIYFQF